MDEQQRRWESINFAKRIEANNKYGFTIVFNGTDENAETHKRFLKLSQSYDGVYITTLKALLDAYEERATLDRLFLTLNEYGVRISLLESRETTEKKPAMKTFGGA